MKFKITIILLKALLEAVHHIPDTTPNRCKDIAEYALSVKKNKDDCNGDSSAGYAETYVGPTACQK